MRKTTLKVVVLALGLFSGIAVSQENVEHAVRSRAVITIPDQALVRVSNSSEENSTNINQLSLMSATQVEALGSQYAFGRSATQVEALGSQYAFGRSATQVEALGSQYAFGRSATQVEALGSQYAFGRSATQVEALGSQYAFGR